MSGKQEVFDGVEWQHCIDGAEVDIVNTPTTPIPISGTLTISAGSFSAQLGNELNALYAFAQTGIMTRTGAGSYTGRTIVASTGISVSNGNGLIGNPTIALSTVPINKLANYPNTATKVLYGDGQWRTLNLPSNIATTTYVDSTVANHIVQINKLAGYPNNSALVLKGNGMWGSINSFSSSIDMNNNRITELGNPINTYDAATKYYVDNKNSFSSNLDMNGYKITELGLPTSTTDATNKSYVDNRIIPINKLASYPNNSNYLLKGNGTWGAFTPNFTSYGSTYNIPVNNTYSSATETGFDFRENGSSRLKIGINSSNNLSYLKSYTTLEFYVGNSLSFKVWPDGASMNNKRLKEVANPTYSNDAATKSYVDTQISAIPSGGGSNPLDDTEVNVNNVYTNWLRRGYRTRTNVTIYGMNSSNGFIFENHSGESAGIAFSGARDNCTIWTAGDYGYFLNIQDEDSVNRKAYVSTNGSWTVVSSQENKYSIKDKSNNNILNRFMDLSVKTYGFKYDEGKFKKKKTERIARKSREMRTGLVLEDLFKIFPNCISDYRNELFQEKDKKKKLSLEKEVKDIKNAGIDYNTLMCYFIMAFQEFVEKTNNKIKQLEAKND